MRSVLLKKLRRTAEELNEASESVGSHLRRQVEIEVEEELNVGEVHDD